MGRNLFIRVSAETYDEKEVIRAWPTVCAMVWLNMEDGDLGSPGKIIRDLLPNPKPGVLQLVDAFVDYVHLGNTTDAARSVLTEAAKTLERLRAELDAALGNRDVRAASGLATAIEAALDQAEDAARRLRA